MVATPVPPETDASKRTASISSDRALGANEEGS